MLIINKHFNFCCFRALAYTTLDRLCAVFLYNICCFIKVSTYICFRPSFDDVTRINFRFRLLVTWSPPCRRGASYHIIWCKIALSSPKLLTFFFRNSRWRTPPSWISENVNNSELDRAICAKFGGQIHHGHAEITHDQGLKWGRVSRVGDPALIYLPGLYRVACFYSFSAHSYSNFTD